MGASKIAYTYYPLPHPFPPPPLTRAGCKDTPRPCPHFGCRMHMASNIAAPVRNRGPKRLKVYQLPEGAPSCALDMVDAHPHGMELSEIAAAMSLDSKQLAAQVEAIALRKLARSGDAAQLYAESPE